MRPLQRPLLLSMLVLSATFAACGEDDVPAPAAAAGGSSGATGSAGSSAAARPEQTGAICQAAGDCYPGLDQSTLSGPAICLDRVREGYCTHGCSADADCCAAEGECKTAFKQVCSPFESTGKTTCFLSCEKEDIGDADESTYCQKNASYSFVCRSSGGGKENRKVCVPGSCGAGAICAADSECAGGLTCLTAFNGGYCGKPLSIAPREHRARCRGALVRADSRVRIRARDRAWVLAGARGARRGGKGGKGEGGSLARAWSRRAGGRGG